MSQGKVGLKDGCSACGGWIGMVDDESHAFKRRQRTKIRCSSRRRVVSATSTTTTNSKRLTCRGMGARSTQAQRALNTQPRASRPKQLAYLAPPFPPAHLEAVQIHLAQRVGVEATVGTAPLNQLTVDWTGHADCRAQRTHSGSNTSSCRRGCRHVMSTASHR